MESLVGELSEEKFAKLVTCKENDHRFRPPREAIQMKTEKTKKWTTASA